MIKAFLIQTGIWLLGMGINYLIDGHVLIGGLIGLVLGLFIRLRLIKI